MNLARREFLLLLGGTAAGLAFNQAGIAKPAVAAVANKPLAFKPLRTPLPLPTDGLNADAGELLGWTAVAAPKAAHLAVDGV